MALFEFEVLCHQMASKGNQNLNLDLAAQLILVLCQKYLSGLPSESILTVTGQGGRMSCGVTGEHTKQY